MSWGTSSTDAAPKTTLRGYVRPPTVLIDLVDEQDDQYAVGAAHGGGQPLGGVQGGGDDVMVTMGGHANPDHAPRSGWAEEFITVTVTARPRSA